MVEILNGRPARTGKSIRTALTVTNGVYTIADVVGGLITFSGAVGVPGGMAIVNSVKLAGVVAIAYELWLFSDIATVIADNGAMALVLADTLNCIGVVPIAVADYCAAQSAFNVATVRGIGLEVQAATASTALYGYLKATAVTSPATTVLYLTLDLEYLP